MPQQPDEYSLLNALMSLIYLLLGVIIIALGYLTMGDMIDWQTAQKRYTHEELQALTEDRKALREQSRSEEWDRIENGIHVNTGLKAGKHLDIVISSCTSCHSAKLITQNRASRAGWKQMIDWMQETQGLQDLGRSEGKILDYLAAHYAPTHVGRRQNLDVDAIKWYVLELEGDE